MGEDLRPEKWSKATGNAQIVELKSLNYHLNRLQIDQFIAEIAGQKENLKEISGANPK